MRTISHIRGFSLIETVVTITITTIIMMTVTGLIVFFYKTNATVLEQASAVASARRGIESAMADVREATYAENGAYPIEEASPNKIRFYADIDFDNAVEQVEYELVDTTLYRRVTEASGTPPQYTQSPEIFIVSDNVRNETFDTNIFQYTDEAGNVLAGNPPAIDVALITITLVVSVNPTQSEEEFVLTSSAMLRNVKNK